jgi:hypothetical protein
MKRTIKSQDYQRISSSGGYASKSEIEAYKDKRSRHSRFPSKPLFPCSIGMSYREIREAQEDIERCSATRKADMKRAIKAAMMLQNKGGEDE